MTKRAYREFWIRRKTALLETKLVELAQRMDKLPRYRDRIRDLRYDYLMREVDGLVTELRRLDCF